MLIPDPTTVITLDDPTPDTDTVILEDDTCGVLAAPAVLRRYNEHPVRLYSSLHRFRPYPVGSLRRQGNTLLAIAVDLDSEPVCTPDSIHNAAVRLTRHPLTRIAGSIRLQMLGCIHAAMTPEPAFSALCPFLEYLYHTGVNRLYLQVRSEHKRTVSQLIQTNTQRGCQR